MKYNSFFIALNLVSIIIYQTGYIYHYSIVLRINECHFSTSWFRKKSIFQHNKSKHSASNMAIDYHIHKYILIIAQDSSVMIWYRKISITSYCTHFLMIYNKATTYKSIDLYIQLYNR